MSKLISIFCISLVIAKSFGQTTQDQVDYFKDADAFFQKHVKDGLVAYDEISKNPEGLNMLIDIIEKTSLENKNKQFIKAFWINAYNLITIKSIVSKWPIGSPLDDENFFTGEKHKAAGLELTLSDIEKEKLMKPFGDARVHFVIVCAAKGCPKLASHAYFPEKLETQIINQTKKTLNDPYFIRLNAGDKSVAVSEIFNWYKSDFVTSDMDIVSYINQFRDTVIPSTYSVSYYTYDWQANEQ